MKRTENVTKVYDHFYRYQEIVDILKAYTEEYPNLASMESIGTTPEGREIYVITVTDRAAGAPEDKPAFFAEGNIHAGEVTGCMTCMYLLDVIFSNLDDPYIAETLRNYTIYVLPRVSPDGSEHYLTTPDYVRSVPRFYPYEEEMPGLQPADLDGDGVVRKMRVRSPYGIWKESESDPRIMTRRRPDETTGTFYNIYSEGLIKEYDGVNIVSAPGKFGNDFNRNYPIGWKPEHEQRGAGEIPLSNPETLANTKFLLAHHNVCAVLDMHTMGGQNLYTPGFKTRKETERADIQIYKQLGQMAKEENGYPIVNVFDEYMPAGSQATYGGFDDFCHFILGVPAFTIECWDLDVRVGLNPVYPPKEEETWEEQEETARKYIAWIDRELEGEEHDRAILPWTKFDHPQLGEVEIGGIDYKSVIQNPPIKFLVQELEKHTRFMLRYIHTLPQISFSKINVTRLGAASEEEDLFKLEVQVMNTGYLATYVFKEALKMKSLKPLTLEIVADPAASAGAAPAIRFIEGKAKTEIGQLEGFSGLGGYNGGMGASTFQKDPCEKKYSFILAAKPGTKLTLTVTGGRSGKLVGDAEL